jgi:hypothetical protein
MLLSQTLFSIGLFVPLSTLSLRLFMDALQFISLLQTKLNKIEIIRQLQMILFQKKNVKFLISNQQLCKILGLKTSLPRNEWRTSSSVEWNESGKPPRRKQRKCELCKIIFEKRETNFIIALMNISLEISNQHQIKNLNSPELPTNQILATNLNNIPISTSLLLHFEDQTTFPSIEWHTF